jgi:large subunit ribosomal protein L30
VSKKTQCTTVVITRTKSSIGAKRNHRETLRSLGLKRIGDQVTRELDPITEGMVRTVSHMIVVEPVGTTPAATKKASAPASAKETE